MKTTALVLLAIAGLAVGCNRSNHDDNMRARDSRGMVSEQAARGDRSADPEAWRRDNAGISASDQTFLKEAAVANMSEVEMGRVGLRNADSDRVKAFSQKMVDDHTKANEEVKTLARSKSVAIPMELPSDKRAMVNTMSKKNGMDFDHAFIDHMVEGHQKVVDMFERQSKTGEDAAVRAFAARMLPTLRGHLQLAKDIQTSMGTSPGQLDPDTTPDTRWDRQLRNPDSPGIPRSPIDPASPANPDFPQNPPTRPTNPEFPPR